MSRFFLQNNTYLCPKYFRVTIMITIGNPIFDSVFKFFLADDVAARILLSVLIKKKVTKLETRKNEFMQKGDEGELSVMKIDFAAHVLSKDENGKEVDQLIIIELQKAWVNYEVPRFRRYLGSNYIASENIFHDEKDDRDYGLPIIAVYILNHRVGTLTEPVVRLNRKYYDYDDNELTVGVPDKFAESLSHDCIIVQVPLLTGKIKNRAEKILQIFNQKFTVKKSGFKMQFDDSLADGDVEMQKLVSRLSMVFTDEHTTELMISENEEYQEHIAHLTTKAELAKQKEMLAQKDKELEEKDNQLAASIKMLSSLGIAPEQIAENLKISVKTVKDLLGGDDSK
ncbi:MAG: hypothetical protein K5685_08140 [Bacteroidales bacterium]|nr:hypothetical protein [Bacteroidales bacterium]